MTTKTETNETRRAKPRTLRVGLLGLGTVGEAVCTLLRRRRRHLRRKGLRIEPVAALARTRRGRATDDWTAFRRGDYDCVVEAMGGLDPAYDYVRWFLDRGVPVVTANKALLAERGEQLAGRPLLGEAAVAAGIPLLRTLERALHTTRVDSIAAILNGTSNFVLSRIERDGLALGAAVEEARRAGFAEADPSLDLNGTDAAQKLSLLAGRLGRSLPVDGIERESLDGLRPADVRRARALGYRIKPVAFADGRGGFVGPALVTDAHPLARIADEQNAVVLDGDPLGRICLSGPGAGGPPTAASIIDDLVAVARGDIREWSVPPPSPAPPRPPATRWFTTLQFAADPGDAIRLLDVVELRRLPDEPLPTVAAITPERPRTEALRALRALHEARSFRVLPEN